MKPVKSESGKSLITDILNVLVNECGGEATPGEWAKACEATLNLKRNGFEQRKEKAEKAKLVKTSGRTSKTICRLAEGVKKDPDTGDFYLPSYHQN